MEITFVIAITATIVITLLAAVLLIAAIVRKSNILGSVGVVLFALVFVFGGIAVVQHNEEADENYERHKCITVKDNLKVDYNGTTYTIDADYVTMCEVPR